MTVVAFAAKPEKQRRWLRENTIDRLLGLDGFGPQSEAPNLETVARKLHDFARLFRRRELDECLRRAKVDRIVGRLEQLRESPNPALKSQLRAIIRQYLALIGPSCRSDPDVEAGLNADLARIFGELLAAAVSDAVLEPVIRLADRRAQIRRDRGYLGQAGPPPDPENTFGPWWEPEAELDTKTPLKNRSDVKSAHRAFATRIFGNAPARPQRGSPIARSAPRKTPVSQGNRRGLKSVSCPGEDKSHAHRVK